MVGVRNEMSGTRKTRSKLKRSWLFPFWQELGLSCLEFRNSRELPELLFDRTTYFGDAEMVVDTTEKYM